VLGRLLSGTFWLALRTPLQVIFAFWSIPLILESKSVGESVFGAYGFAWGFGFLQFLLEFGMSSALNRQISERWTQGDRAGVERSIATGLRFYAAMAVLQAVVLVAISQWGIPPRFTADQRGLITRLLWLQALTAPCFGLSTVVGSVLQAARRYDFIPRFELAIVVLRFVVLWFGLHVGVDFFVIVTVQTLLSIGLSLGPALGVMTRQLGLGIRFAGATRGDFLDLTHISIYMFLMQLSVVLADRIDTTILGYALEAPSTAIAIYQTISKPFSQIRQIGWMLAYLVMPAVASLAAANDRAALERIKYDGTRLLVAVLLPIALLAAIDARPFLAAWVPQYHDQAGWMQLFLVATLPLVLAVPVQMAIGLGKIRVIALAALAGSLVNLPLSYVWTRMAGDVSGVIWGTVLTTWVSNLLIPGLYCARVLAIDPVVFLRRTLGAPLAAGAVLVAAALASRGIVSDAAIAGATRLERATPLVIHLTIGLTAYLAGYLLTPTGRADLRGLLDRLRRRQAG
jgi:O-antigen/teichoic acid export membrane protein